MVVKKDIDAKMAEEMLLGSLLYKPDKIIHIIDEINLFLLLDRFIIAY